MVISIILMLCYIACSASGLILLKMGLNHGTVISFSTALVEIKVHTLLIAGALLYVVSFLLNLVVMGRFDLSYVYPVSAGLIYIAILVLSVALLKEKITTTQIVGMAAILIGIVIMNLKK